MKIFLFVSLLLSTLYASVVVRDFEAGISFYGKTGDGNITYERHKENYIIHLRSKPTDFISKLSGYKGAEFISEGNITKEGIYIPHIFTDIKDTKKKYEKTVYTFDHKNTILKKSRYQKHFDHKSHFDVHTFKVVKSHEIREEYSVNDINYSKNDYLTLIENVKFLDAGEINYVDKSKDDTLTLLKNSEEYYEIRVDKKDASYMIRLFNDTLGFKKAQTIEATIFGDAWINMLDTKQQ